MWGPIAVRKKRCQNHASALLVLLSAGGWLFLLAKEINASSTQKRLSPAIVADSAPQNATSHAPEASEVKSSAWLLLSSRVILEPQVATLAEKLPDYEWSLLAEGRVLQAKARKGLTALPAPEKNLVNKVIVAHMSEPLTIFLPKNTAQKQARALASEKVSAHRWDCPEPDSAGIASCLVRAMERKAKISVIHAAVCRSLLLQTITDEARQRGLLVIAPMIIEPQAAACDQELNLLLVASITAAETRRPSSQYGAALDLVAAVEKNQAHPSVAAALNVAAAAERMLKANGSLGADEMEAILVASATDLGAQGRDSRTGWGKLSADRAVELVEADKENLPPIANFEAIPERGIAPLHVAFDAGASTDPDGLVMRYEWNFGNGVNRGPELLHTFSEPGTYEVTLTIIDDGGKRSRRTRTIEVLR